MTSHRDEPPAGSTEPIVVDISDVPILQRGCPPDDDPDGQVQWFAAVLRLWLYRTRDEGWTMPGPEQLKRFGEWLAGPDGPQSWSWPR